MKIVHLSDIHNQFDKVQIPDSEFDVAVYTGDIGMMKTGLSELTRFLIWFESVPAKVKIFHAGNHDIILDKGWIARQQKVGSIEGMLASQAHTDAMLLINQYKVKYLNEKEYVYEGIKFFGSPYSPSFHRENWVFNADRGQEIKTHWGKIPADVDVLLTHTPPFGTLDVVPEYGRTEWHKDGHVGCEDLSDVIQSRLTKLKLHCFGHIHENYGVVNRAVSNRRRVLFSNGACVDNQNKILITRPLIIEI